MNTFLPTKILSVAESSLLIMKLASTLIRNQQHVSLCYFTLQNYLTYGKRCENGHEEKSFCEYTLTVDYCYRGNIYIDTVLVRM
jgi:hypothetical protein